ncbi:amino acid adenylation domain-containing protein [Paenibacillus sp. MZ04-78.2]|uniref:non-ribosomal peptide synthetase n=1 Tax=Paenibacillus sp. MZ04-78.2 TaxID=2962034 RepID=UPI0020B7BCED|nr:amino acid adenylation domain-containing protein [Paenibacillus sp. MZ04-78.2]
MSEYQQRERFWSSRFEPEDHLISLPSFKLSDSSEESDSGSTSASMSAPLPAEISQRIMTMTGGSPIAVYLVLLVGVEFLLYKYTGEESLIVGMPTVEDETDESLRLDQVILIKQQLEADSTFKTVFQALNQTIGPAVTHQHIPFHKMIGPLDVNYDSEQRPVIRTIVSLDNIHTTRFKETAASEIWFQFDLSGDSIGLKLTYDTSAYDHSFIKQVTRHLHRIYSIILFQPDLAIRQLDILTEQETNHFLQAFKNTSADYPKNKPIYRLFEEQVARTPDQIAVLGEHEPLTYRQLNERSNQLARSLLAKGLQAEQFVGIMAERSCEMLIAVLAVLKAGGAYVPIDPDYPEDRVRYMLEDSGARLLLIQKHLQERTAFAGIRVDLNDSAAFDQDGSNVNLTVNPLGLAYVIYTSGTTGRPKGAMITHQGLVNYIWWAKEVYVGEDRLDFPLYSSISFDLTVTSIFTPLITGNRVRIYEGEDAVSFIRRIVEENQVDIIKLTPTHLSLISEWKEPQGTRIRKLIVGGENLSVSLAKSIHEQFGGNIVIFNEYGPTETVVGCMIHRYDPTKDTRESVPIGTPAANVSIYLLDAQQNLVPVGVPGEMYIAGDGVAMGYYNRPELTEEKFVEPPIGAGQRMYRTGDLARWLPDGTIEYMGRIDQQVKIRGYRIETAEVEAALLRIDGIQKAAVLAADHPHDASLCAYYVASKALSRKEIEEQLSQSLPAFMIPSYLIALEALPLTANGKLDRRALPSPSEKVQEGTDYTAPRTKLEQLLAAVWESVLGVKRVGITDHFFQLGGDSIKSIQVTSRLYQAGYKFEIKHLFKYPTIAELIPYVEPVTRLAEQGEIRGTVALTPIQRWFFAQPFPDQHHYNQAVLLYWKDGLEEDKLRAMMTKLVEHHDALRTVFVPTAQGYEARNRGIDEGELFSLDVFALSEEQEIAEEVEARAEEIQRSIHLAEGPLVKLGLFQCQEGEHLLIVVHHLLIDGISWRILFEDLATAYEQLMKGESIQLPKKTDSYQLWAEELERYTRSVEFDKSKSYWHRQPYASAPALPKDTEEDAGLIQDQETVVVQWTTEETERLVTQANRAYTTEMNDLLLTGLGIAIHQWTGHEEILIQLEGHGREPIIPDLDISRTVGWFTSQYPVILSIGANQGTSQRIRSVKEQLRQIPQKGIGFGLLRYGLASSDVFEPAKHPEISFNYLGQFEQEWSSGAVEVSPYSSGALSSRRQPLLYSLDMNGMIAAGRLSLAISYSGKQYRKETIERFAELLRTSLRQVVDHCVEQDRIQLTPSDIVLKGMSMEALDHLVRQSENLGVVENVYPLTPMQKGMLFHSLIDSASGAYFEQAAFELRGHLDIGAFVKSLEQLTERHDILRTNFYAQWQQPLQLVFREKPVETVVRDIRGLNDQERCNSIDAFIQEDKARGLDLTCDALMRVTILRTGEERTRIIWSFHHILMDGWCLPLITKEVFDAYYALLERRQPARGALTPYSRYIEWLGEQEHERAAAYWRNYLDGYEGQTVLLKDPGASASGTYRKQRHIGRLGKALTEQLQRTASDHQVTVNTWIQTAWGLLLQRYNSSTDVVFGTVVSGRPAEIPGIEAMIGLFINTIPVRVQAQTEMTVAELVKRNQEQALASQEYDTYPLYEIQAQTPQKQQLISHIMVFENYPVEKQMEQLNRNDKVLEITDFYMEEHTHYDFTCIVIPAEEMEIHFVYNAEAYDRPSVERMQSHLMELIRHMLSEPMARICELNLLGEEERTLLTETWNDTAAEYPRQETIHHLFEEQARRTPDHPAVKYEQQVLTYHALDERANRLARTLLAKGLQPEQLVGIIAERSLEMVIGILAILKAGGVYVPIDPDYPNERIQYMLEDSAASIVLTQIHLLENVVYQGQVIFLDDPASYDVDPARPRTNVPSNQLAYVIYTSGTTGNPKGTLIEHKNVVRLLMNSRNLFDFNESDTWTLFHSFCFDFSVWEMFGALLHGGKLVIVPKKTARSPESYMQLLRSEAVTVLNQTPSYFYQLQQLDKGNSESDLAIRKIIFGGEALSPSLLKDWKHKYPSTQLINMYGITETTVHVTYKEITEREIEESRSTIGQPIPTLQVYVLNEYRQLQPLGVPGELYVAGEGLARGYLNRPDLTAERFVDHPFAPDQKMYKTGDIARWLPDGQLEYVGRVDHQVKIRGYRIEIGEVEAALLRMESIKEVAVVAYDGEGSKQLCAYLVGNEGLQTVQLKRQLLQRLPEYMVPTHFVQVEAMPLTANGKVDRKALPAPHGHMSTGTDYLAPSTWLEQRLTDIWTQVLAHPKLGVQDNFFDVGGHSLKVLQLIHQINTDLELSLKYHVIYEYPTIETLARFIQASAALDSSNDNPFIRLNSDGLFPVFCFPPLLGFGLVYNELAGRLDGDCVFYAADFIEEMLLEEQLIERYVEHIVSIQKEGPYMLLGYSSGANLAFEVAQALERRGYAVSDIIMLDSKITASVTYLSEEEIQEIVYLNMDIIPEYYQELLTIPLIHNKIRSYLAYHNQLVNSGLVRASIHHLLCEELNRVERGWERSTTQRYTEYKLAGEHVTIFAPDHMEANADTLRAILHRIAAERHTVTCRNA